MFGIKKNPGVSILLLFVFILPTSLLFAGNNSPQDDEMGKLFKMSLEELMKMKVTTAGKTGEDIRDIPASVVVITREDIKTYGYQSLEEILESIPGLYYTNDYFWKNIGIRGFWSVQALRNLVILVNDVPQTEHSSNVNELESLNLHVGAIDRIEVVRGPMSVMYGSGAFFGVINIFTNKIVEGEPLSLVSASIGSEKTKQTIARVSGISKDRDFQYTFNASYLDTHGIDVPYEKLGAVGHPVPTTGGQLKYRGTDFNFSGRFKGFSVDADYSVCRKNSSFLIPSLAEGTRLDIRKLNLFFGYRGTVSNKVTVSAKFGVFSFRKIFIYDFMFENIYARQNNQSSGYKAELNIFFHPTPGLDIIAGVDYNTVLDVKNENNVPELNINDIHNELADGNSMVTRSVFAQIDYRLSDRLKIAAGARLEQVPKYSYHEIKGHSDSTDPLGGTYTKTQAAYDREKVEFIPRIALIYQPARNHAVKFLYGKAINRPSFFQNIQAINYPSEFQTSLSPETIRTFEINYIANLSSKLSVGLSLFRNILDNLIYRTLSIVDNSVVSHFANVGEINTNGIELSIQTAPTENLYLGLSATCQDTTDKRPGLEGIEPGYAPKFLGYLKASYFFNKDISLAITGNYVDEMETYYDATLSPPARIGEKTAGYFLLGANLRIRDLLGTGLYLGFRGSNLLDREVHYPTTSNNSLFAVKGTVGRGRTFLLTVGWEF